MKTAATGESVGDSGGLAAHDHGPHLAHYHPPGGLVDADANLDGVYNDVWAAGNSGANSDQYHSTESNWPPYVVVRFIERYQ